MLRSLLRSTATVGAGSISGAAAASSIFFSRSYAKAKPPPSSKGNKKKSKGGAEDSSSASASAAAGDFSATNIDILNAEFEMPKDPLPPTYDRDLDVGPAGRPLFAFADTFAKFSHRNVNTYVDFSLDEWKAVLPEGLPQGMMKEFEETRRCAVMVRESFLDLRDHFRRIVDPPLASKRKEPKRQIVLDGPKSCGKSIALAMLVHWARMENWLVFYVPKGKEWTHGGFFYKSPYNNEFWDTPLQAARVLQDFLKFNEAKLQNLPCKIPESIPLGEGAGVGLMKGADSMTMPENSTLYDLIQTGILYTHASVGVLVRLREELSLVKDVPVLFVIDQYNSWFTFTEYQEPMTPRSCRPIHAKELASVNKYRSMMHNDMMIGAFSHSTAVGKLREHLPDVPRNARVLFPRYTLKEAEAVCYYYLRQKLIKKEKFSEERWKKIFYLSNGNGSEMRWLAPFI